MLSEACAGRVWAIALQSISVCNDELWISHLIYSTLTLHLKNYSVIVSATGLVWYQYVLLVERDYLIKFSFRAQAHVVFFTVVKATSCERYDGMMWYLSKTEKWSVSILSDTCTVFAKVFMFLISFYLSVFDVEIKARFAMIDSGEPTRPPSFQS